MSQKTVEVPDLAGLELPEGSRLVGFLKNGANHLLLCDHHGLYGCLKNRVSDRHCWVKVATDKDFVKLRTARHSEFRYWRLRDPNDSQSGFVLVAADAIIFDKTKETVICTGSSLVRIAA